MMTPEMKKLVEAMQAQDHAFSVLALIGLFWLAGSLAISRLVTRLAGSRSGAVLQFMDGWVLPACFLAATVALFLIDFLSNL